MAIDAAQPRRRQHLLRKNAAIGNHHRHIQVQRTETLRKGPGVQAPWLASFDAQRFRPRHCGRRLQLLPPARGPIRLGDHGHDVVPSLHQRIQGGHRKGGRSKERNPQVAAFSWRRASLRTRAR